VGAENSITLVTCLFAPALAFAEFIAETSDRRVSRPDLCFRVDEEGRLFASRRVVGERARRS
jgi:hypothetical protein